MSNNDEDAPNNTENASISLEAIIREKLQKLPPLSPSCSIYRIPERFRCLNPNVYTPKVVSIGPLHHGKDTLQDMEEHKYRYLQNFLDRTNESMECYIQKTRYHEENLRSCYAETIKFSSDDFVTTMLVDAAFIVEIFCNQYFKEAYSADRIMINESTIILMINDIKADLLLLENQLPFFILEDIFDADLIVDRNSRTRNSESEKLTCIQLCRTFFRDELVSSPARCCGVIMGDLFMENCKSE